MKQCTYCGAELADEVTVCTNCGRSLEEAAQQPTQEPMEAESLVSQEQLAAEPFVYEVAPVEKTRKRWPWITGGIVLLLAVLAALYFFVLRKPDPKPPTAHESLTASLQGTIADFKTMFANSETLRERVNTLRSQPRDKTHLFAELMMDGPNSSIDSLAVQLDANADLQGKVIAEGDLHLSVFVGENHLPITLRFSLDHEQLQLSLPDFVDEAYSLSLADLKEALAIDDETVKTLTKLLEPKPTPVDLQVLKQQVQQLWDTAEVTEITDTVSEIPVEGDPKLYECFQVAFDKVLYTQIVDQVFGKSFEEFLAEAKGDADEERFVEQHIALLRGEGVEAVLLHVYNNKVIGLELQYTLDGEEMRDELWLKGEENLFSHIEILSDVDGYASKNTIYAEANERGFVLTFAEEDRKIVLDYDDTDCTLVLRREGDYDSNELRLWLQDWDGESRLSLEIATDEVNAALTVGIAPMETAPERLSEEAQDLLTMSQQDLEKLLLKIFMKLATDPETSWVMESLQSLAA